MPIYYICDYTSFNIFHSFHNLAILNAEMLKHKLVHLLSQISGQNGFANVHGLLTS